MAGRMALRSSPLLSLVWLAVAFPESSCGSFSHSLKFTSFTISEPSQGLPHFVMLVDVDDHVLLHYDRETGKMQPRVSWIEKLKEDDPEFWDKVFKEAHEVEKMFVNGLEFVRIFSSHSEARTFAYAAASHQASIPLHLRVVQVILSCDLQGDGSKRGFVQVAYNGESMTPPSTMDKSEMEECIALLEKFLSYGNETLLRTDPPVVTVTRRVEAEDEKETHICRVHGFYPRVVNASWTRDGEVWLQDTLHGSVAPNADATYHYWLSIQIDPKERGRYKCHVEHDGLQEPLDVALKDEGQQGNNQTI
ncbi:major histocompatibility complex class I-related gene protein-like [Pseudonaja textilis]|uniref:major histocompatibility complex class I-related gene protein-like n=1 Tax=Pseudonaja textilis TaxID=8673 RepID=UPI000EAA08BA|nr:major histocompatibility complex class I-related gene protein-like [Pseudonaja textilis]